MGIAKAALKNPYAVVVLALMIVVLGAVAVNNIPVDILPVFKAPAVQMLTYFQGMPASSVEKTITNRTSRVHVNDARQVYVPIYRQQGASTLAVAEGVRRRLAWMEERLPKGTKLDFVMDQSLYVRGAIHSLIEEGIIGAILVSLMILIFLGNWRVTVIACLSIPLALLTAIIGLHATGNTANAMTLGGLALAIGPLVDNAIVVLENTHRHHSLGKSRLKAALEGALELLLPVLVATSTTIIVLCPIALMPGMGGFLFRPLALAVGFAMVGSLILSMTLVPCLCAKWLTEHIHPGEEHTSHGWGGGRTVGLKRSSRDHAGI